MAQKKFLDQVYDIEDAAEMGAFYDKWAASYDDEVGANGYATPPRCAEALAAFAEDKAAPLLDIGCGTGLSGLAFRAAGFETIDGLDLSAEMLAAARARAGVYNSLTQVTLDDPLPFPAESYANIAAVGVLNPGHAPAETMGDALALLPRGGHFVFSLNDHALEDGSYEYQLRELCDAGLVFLMHSEYGAHLPKIGLKSRVYVLRKS
ncbi:MAG: methyltransferase domain-containing protein [Pseudomonadota bacterium]